MQTLSRAALWLIAREPKYRLLSFCKKIRDPGKGEANVDIITYMFFTYGLTALISLLMAGLIVLVNRITSRI